MLRGLRKASSNWLGKLVMAAVVGFLVISFAIWGIGDIFRGFGTSTVAKIGRIEITIDQFRQIYNDRLQVLGRQVGRPITPAQAREAGLDHQILNQLLAESALDERARQLRLGISDAEIARQITEEPAFRGPAGNFDQQKFTYLIRQAGYTEQRYVSEQRRVVARRQLATAIGSTVTPPKTAADALNRFEHEERSIEYVMLDRGQAGELPAPSPETLAKYFEDRKVLFRAPEYRKIVLLTMSPEEIARTIEVSDADAKRAYEERRARYSVPEKREIRQIVYPTAEEAQAAADKLAGGTSFEALAAERKLSEKDTDLGLVTKADILDPAIAEAAFALKEGETSKPVTGRFGTAIVRVLKIEPGRTTPFAEVEGQLKQDLALERARTAVNDRRDKVEDELAAGLRLDEVAQKLNTPAKIVEAVDRSGRGPDGQVIAIPGLPKGVDVLTPAFSTQVGVENDALQIPGGGFLWYEVAGITPSRERTLDEVKDRVEARWRDDEVVARLNTKASEMADKLKTGASLAEVAAASGLKVETASGLKRRESDKLPATAVAEVFQTPKGEVGNTEGKEPTERIVFRVTAVTVPTYVADSPDAKTLVETLRNAYQDELLAQYVVRLQSELGISINQTALAQATGARSQFE
jgi:peptidyl-prolyl cis-trans isomerase D